MHNIYMLILCYINDIILLLIKRKRDHNHQVYCCIILAQEHLSLTWVSVEKECTICARFRVKVGAHLPSSDGPDGSDFFV
jgi:hypothetical protein